MSEDVPDDLLVPRDAETADELKANASEGGKDASGESEVVTAKAGESSEAVDASSSDTVATPTATDDRPKKPDGEAKTPKSDRAPIGYKSAVREVGDSEQWQVTVSDYPEFKAVTMSVADFLTRMNKAREPDVLSGVIGTGVTVVAGPPGAKKGPFVRDMAMAIATGHNFLGVAPRPSTRVLYFSTRLTAVGLANHFSVFDETQLAESAERLKVYGRYIRDSFMQRTLKAIVGKSPEDRNFDVVILDDVQHMYREKSRSMLAIELREWCLEAGVRLILVHQVASGKAANPAGLLLSDELVAAADNVVVLSEFGDNIRVRTFFGGDEVRDDLVNDDWTIIGPTTMHTVTSEKSLVESELLAATELLGRTDIKLATGLEADNVSVALNRLLKENKVVREARALYRHATRSDLTKPK